VAAVYLHLFGSVQVSRASEERETVPLIAPKPLALLAYLALLAPTAVRRDTLLALFWPELPDSGARAALRQAVFHLRRTIGADAVLTDRASVALATDVVSSDVAAFERMIGSGERVAALDLYRGDLLGGFFFSGMSIEFEEWLQHERDRLRRTAIDACWALCGDAERAKNGIGAAQWARRAVNLAPDDEVGVRRLIGILDHFGDRAGALRVAEDLARRLEQQFQATWSPETAALVAAVRARAAIPTAPMAPMDLRETAAQLPQRLTQPLEGAGRGSRAFANDSSAANGVRWRHVEARSS
jgi:DNA-binding SARP family transcriptional activator